MRLLFQWERRIENAVERLFFRGSAKEIHPVDLALGVAKAMESDRRIGVDTTFVPNQFRVLLNPSDLEFLRSVEKRAAEDAKNHIAAIAASRRYSFVGPIHIQLIEDAMTSPGEIRIEARFFEDQVEEGVH